MKFSQAAVSLVPLALVASAVDVESSSNELFTPYKGELSETSFFEQFDKDEKSLKKLWKESHAKRDGEFSYVGKWSFEEPTVYPGLKGDKGLVLKTEAAHHAISAKLPQPFDNTNDTLVLQYEVKLQKGLNCGGAYVKLLSADADVDSEFSNDTPYQVMFGPDKCGTNNKVHFIVRRKNPFTEEYEEKHLSVPPMARSVKTTTLYTLVIKPDQTFEIRINGETVKAGSLLDTHFFKPGFSAPTEIEDPEDVKPEDWVEDEMIPDPNAVKPDDWDEDAPFTINDPNAVKPEDWDESMEEYIQDPEASKPEYWDDDEDGEWVAPKIYNTECDKHGCGKWIAPKIRNPAFKGKWSPPLVENPDYKGEWSPRLIPNPQYYEDNTPSNLEPIGALGFELWTMNEDILFDNIYLGHSIKEAEEIGNATFVPKVELEEISAANNAPKAQFEAEKPENHDSDIESNILSDIFDQAFLYISLFIASTDAFVADLLADPVNCLLNRPGEAFFYATVFVCSFVIVFIIWSLIIYGISSLFSSPSPASVKPKIEEIKEEVEEEAEEEEKEEIQTAEGTSDLKVNETEAIKR